MSIAKIRARLDRIKRCSRTLSEIDTQVLLIEPVLQLAGWDVGDPNCIRRASRDPREEAFDIEACLGAPNNDNSLRLAIECKSIYSEEFNFSKVCSRAKVGKLKQATDDRWVNIQKDGIGQLRAYSLNFRAKFSSADSLAILTNGEKWIVFDNTQFLNNPSEKISEKAIKVYAALSDSDFENKIVEIIRKP